VASFQNTHRTTSNRHWSQSTSKLALPFLQTSCTSFQPLHEQLYSSTAMETGMQQTNSKNVCPLKTCRFQDKLHHFCPHTRHGTNRRQAFLLLCFPSLPPSLTFSDQFALVLQLLKSSHYCTVHTITSMLMLNPFVVVMCLDFSKAFDSLTEALIKKMTQLEILDTAYHRIADFFSSHSHCTKYREETSTFKYITVSIIQGSGIGRAMVQPCISQMPVISQQ